MRDSLRILLVDDHRLAREGLAGILSREHDLDVVGEASNGQMAVNLSRVLHPDVVIMDVRMPILNGIEATRLIMSDSPGTKVIGFTMNPESDLAAAMQEAGAAVCIDKCGPISALLSTIRNFYTA